MPNPIKQNRIVVDYTFALRLLSFATHTGCSDAYGEDEKHAMMHYATSILSHQIETATEQEEIDYLDRTNAREKLKKAIEFLKHRRNDRRRN